MSILKPLLRRIRGLWRDERGITGLETSIMLIAFVVVASVFAFAVLSMGIFTAGETEKAVTGVFGETTSVLALRGSVVAHGEDLPATEYPDGKFIKWVKLVVRPQPGSVELSDETIINYEQAGACTRLPYVDNSSQPGLYWDVEWRKGSGPDFEGDEEAEITLQLYGLRDKLKPGGEFAIAIKPKDAPPQPCIPRQGDSQYTDVSSILFSGDVDLNTRSLLDKDGLEYGLYVFGATGDGITSETTDERDSPDDPYVGRLTFLVHNLAPSGTIDLSGESTVFSYFDSSNQTFSDLPFLEDIENTQVGLGWGILGDVGPQLGPSERAEIQVNLFGLPTLLEPRDKFTVEIRPVDGQPLTIEDKQVPSELNPGTNRLD